MNKDKQKPKQPLPEPRTITLPSADFQSCKANIKVVGDGALGEAAFTFCSHGRWGPLLRKFFVC